jgi:hypothetical protein
MRRVRWSTVRLNPRNGRLRGDRDVSQAARVQGLARLRRDNIWLPNDDDFFSSYIPGAMVLTKRILIFHP